MLEHLALYEGVVELRVRVADLLAVDEELEPFGDALLGAVALCERTHHHGVLGDEGGVDALGLDVVPDQLVDDPRERLGLPDHNLVRLAVLPQFLQLGLDVRAVQLDARLHTELLEQRDPPVGPREVDYLLLLLLPLGAPLVRGIGDLQTAEELAHQDLQELLRHAHGVLVVRIGHVELAGGELGVVREVDALVPEHPPYLVHPVEAPHHQLLVVELRADPEEQVHLQLVVVGDERFGRCAPERLVHDRGLHLDEVFAVQVVSQGADHRRSGHEPPSRLLVDEQVHVPLPVDGLRVLQAVEGGGQRPQARGQDAEGGHEDRELPPLRLADNPLVADDVAPVQPLELPDYLVRVRRSLRDHQLQLARLLLDLQELRLRAVCYRH